MRREDIVWTYSGVRPLFDDGASKAQEATRDYVLKADGGEGEAPMVNVFGGKLTTYRRLAEHVVEEIGRRIGVKGASWTASTPLPGGDFPVTGFTSEMQKLKRDYPFLESHHAERLFRLYGRTAYAILGGATSQDDLGECLGHDLYEAEIDHLVEKEWAMTAEDVLWRRTKLGLRLDDLQKARVAARLRDNARARAVEGVQA